MPLDTSAVTMPMSTLPMLRILTGLCLAAPAEVPATEDVAPQAASEVAPAPPIEPAALDGATRLDAEGLFRAEETAYEGYMAGQQALDAGDIEGARRHFDDAVATLPDERPYAGSRGALAMWLVLAAQAAYSRDGSMDALRAEVGLLRGWLARLPELEPDDAERRASLKTLVQARVEAVRAQIDWELAEHGDADAQLAKSLEGGYETNTFGPWRPPTALLAWKPRPDDPREGVRQATEAEEAPEKLAPQLADEPTRPRGTGLLAGGSVALAAGIAGVVVGALGMRNAAAANTFDAEQTPAQRRAQMVDGERGNVTAVVGLSAGGALLVTGITMLAVGARRRGRSLQISPQATARHVGVSVGGRF